MPWCTDECYEKSCKDRPTQAFLIFSGIAVAALLCLSIYMVARPIQCKNDTTTERFSQIYKLLHAKVPRCQETSISIYPQVVAIVEKNTKAHLCSGVIISKEWVLTVAHCLVSCRNDSCSNYVIHAGSSHSNRGGEEYEIFHLQIHPQFNSINLRNNVGLLKVGGFNLSNKNIKVAKVSSSLLKPGIYADVLGWAPYNTIHGFHRDNALKKIDLTLTSTIICQYRLKGEYGGFKVTNRMLCGTYTTRGGGCYTDAGGPLIIKNVLAGLAMFGQMCYNCDYHINVLVNIHYFREFIKKFTEIDINLLKV